MNAERAFRKAQLARREQEMHDLYMAAPPGSYAEKYYEAELEKIIAEYEAICREEQIEQAVEWHRNAARGWRDTANQLNPSER